MNCREFKKFVSKIAIQIEQSIPELKRSNDLREYSLVYANHINLLLANNFNEIVNTNCTSSSKAVSAASIFPSIITPLRTCIDITNPKSVLPLLTYIGIFVVFLDDLLDSGAIKGELVKSRIIPILESGISKNIEELNSDHFDVLEKATKLINLEIQKFDNNSNVILKYFRKCIYAELCSITSARYLLDYSLHTCLFKKLEEKSGYVMSLLWAVVALAAKKPPPEKFYTSAYEFGRLIGWLDDIADIEEDINNKTGNVCILLALQNSNTVYLDERAVNAELYKSLSKHGCINRIVQYGFNCYELLGSSIDEFDTNGELKKFINSVFFAHINALKA